ncbi:MAG: SIMPL domain-containing protein [Thermomicrobiales bacterium]
MNGFPSSARRAARPMLALALLAVTGFSSVASGVGAGIGLAPATAFARQAEMAQPAIVTVNGHGVTTAQPDTATVTIGVDVIRVDLAEAQAEANRQATGIIAALKAAGVEQGDIQTSNYSVNVQRDYSNGGDPTRVTGFEVMNQVEVTVRDIEHLGDLMGEAVTAGANSIWGVTFFVADPEPFTVEARKLAVADARDKAGQLAAAAGMDLGNLVSISEGANGYNPTPMYGRGGGGMGGGGSSVPVEAGLNEVAVDVVMTWELK